MLTELLNLKELIEVERISLEFRFRSTQLYFVTRNLINKFTLTVAAFNKFHRSFVTQYKSGLRNAAPVVLTITILSKCYYLKLNLRLYFKRPRNSLHCHMLQLPQ
jgi:hypothetical protein